MIAISPPVNLAAVKPNLPKISWEKLPDDFILPEEPVDNHLQPLLANALRD